MSCRLFTFPYSHIAQAEMCLFAAVEGQAGTCGVKSCLPALRHPADTENKLYDGVD